MFGRRLVVQIEPAPQLAYQQLHAHQLSGRRSERERQTDMRQQLIHVLIVTEPSFTRR